MCICIRGVAVLIYQLHVNVTHFGMLTSLSLGCVSTVTTFDEDEIVAGDLVKVELDLELFKMMHESVGLWSSIMSEVKCFMIDDIVSLLFYIIFSSITVV